MILEEYPDFLGGWGGAPWNHSRNYSWNRRFLLYILGIEQGRVSSGEIRPWATTRTHLRLGPFCRVSPLPEISEPDPLCSGVQPS